MVKSFIQCKIEIYIAFTAMHCNILHIIHFIIQSTSWIAGKLSSYAGQYTASWKISATADPTPFHSSEVSQKCKTAAEHQQCPKSVPKEWSCCRASAVSQKCLKSAELLQSISSVPKVSQKCRAAADSVALLSEPHCPCTWLGEGEKLKKLK